MEFNDIEAGMHIPGGTADVTYKNYRVREETIVEMHGPQAADRYVGHDSPGRRLEKGSREDSSVTHKRSQNASGGYHTPGGAAHRGKATPDHSPSGYQRDSTRSPPSGPEGSPQAKGMPKDSIISEQNLYHKIRMPDFLLSYEQYQ